MLKNIINTIHQIFNVVSKNLKSIGFKAGRLRFNRLKNHNEYSFKNKQKFELQQKEYVNFWMYRIFIMWIVLYLLIYFIFILQVIPQNLFIQRILGIMVIIILAIIIIVLLIIECIGHLMMSYIFGVPLLAFLLTYVICSCIKHSQVILFAYFIVCLISYSFFIFILPINIFRKITPQIVFLPIISSIVVQLITNYRDVMLNYTMSGITDKVSNSFFKDNFMPIKSKSDFIKFLYEMYVYLFVERKTNIFYNQLAELCGGITLTFLIGGIIVTIRTHYLDSKADKKWKNIIYSSSVKYNDLIECAYIGGRNYENLILSNVDFIKIIKDEEKDISEEKSWKERMKDWFKSMFKR